MLKGSPWEPLRESRTVGPCRRGAGAYLPERRVRDAVQARGALVGQVVEDVEGADRLWPPLLVAEDQVDPLVQLAGDKLALQGLQGGERA